MTRRILYAACLLLLVGCRTGDNYLASEEPRYASAERMPAAAAGHDHLRVVAFNIRYGIEVDSAIALITQHPVLRDVNVLLLQEMDEAGARRIADTLGMAWVYYPSMRSRRTGRDFGNAVLSRWPIVEDEKLILPHIAVFNRTHRIATAATLLVGDSLVRVYSTHLAMVLEGTDARRRDQLATIFRDAAPYARVIIGGDMNDEDVGRFAVASGYDWPTRHGPRTTGLARWDHVFTRGLELVDHDAATGTVIGIRGASDHRPVWVVLRRP